MSESEESKRRQSLSSLVDGEADSHVFAAVCAAWRSDGATRADWHAYHLIGDVMRSEDLAAEPLRDESFLLALRSRLASEPVVLAPRARPVDRLAAVRQRRGWRTPGAVAAGFVAVAGVVMMTRMGGPVPEPTAPTLAGIGLPVKRIAAAPGSAMVPVSNASVTVDGNVIRDSRLDRYLTAHKQYGSSAALAVPGVVVRSATTLQADR